jgi:GNAT superfamily N-acetyltransferase
MTLVDGKGHGLAKTVSIRLVGLDEYSHVRHLHTQSMANQSLDSLTQAEIDAFFSLVRSPVYSDLLKLENLYGAFLDGQLIGTASWQVNGDDGQAARISSVFVDPMFMRLGIGGRLLMEVEGRAFQSGFNQLGISATLNSVPFFEHAGYQVASRGVKTLGPGCALPVAFLRKNVPRLARTPQAKPAQPLAEPVKS